MRNIARRTFLGLVLMSAALTHAAADKIDDLLKTKMETRKIPGLSLAVVQNGKVVKIKGYGLANVETETPATPQTVYQLASVTKQFTATAIMMLAEDGKLSIDDSIGKHLDNLPTAWSSVTVKHLLNHISGIKSYTDLPDIMTQFRKDVTPKEIIKLAGDSPMDFAPGEKWHYNNTGFFLLGLIIEKVSGKPYGEFLQERIFQPLQMTSTRLNVNQDIISKRATGYTVQAGKLRNGDYVSATQPFSAGALVSTVEDMVKWDQALADGKLLKKASFEQMWTATRLSDGKTQNYGFGWSIEDHNGHREIGHGGGIPGFSTYIGRYIEDKLTVIVLANSDQANAQTFANEIAASYVPALTAKPERAMADADPKLLAKMSALIRATAEDKLDWEQFTPSSRKAIQSGVKDAQEALKSFGKLKEVEMLKQETRDGIQLTTFRLIFANETVHSILGLDKNGKIAAIGIMPGN